MSRGFLAVIFLEDLLGRFSTGVDLNPSLKESAPRINLGAFDLISV